MALLLATLSLGLVASVFADTTTYPNVLVEGPVEVSRVLENTDFLDGPKLSPGANQTTYDWWYFDATSESTNASVTVVFYNSGPDGFINRYYDGPLSATITGAFPNGTLFSLNASTVDQAVISVDGTSIFAEWEGSGFSFNGTDLDTDSPTYIVAIESPILDVFGTITLKSTAPAHLACGPVVAGAQEAHLPSVYWSNAVPDAVAQVDLTVGGSDVAFEDGVGYHDKNWGDRQFLTATNLWYWGHARAGPYSIVWFDAFDDQGVEHFSSYVTRDGKVLASSCEENSVVVRPWGENSTFPPVLTTGFPQGYSAQFDMGGGQEMALNVTRDLLLAGQAGGLYMRAMGTVVLEVVGFLGLEKAYEGRTLFEQFIVPPRPGNSTA